MNRMTCSGIALLTLVFSDALYAQTTSTQITDNDTFEQNLTGWKTIGNATIGVMSLQRSPSLPLWSYSGGKYVSLTKNATVYQWVSIPKGTLGLSIPITGGNTLGHAVAFSGFGVNFYDAQGQYLGNDWWGFDVIRGEDRVPTNSHTSYCCVPRNAASASVWCSTQDNGKDYSEVWLDSLAINAVKNVDPTNLLLDEINGTGWMFFKQIAYDASFNATDLTDTTTHLVRNIDLNAGTSGPRRFVMYTDASRFYPYASLTQLVPLDGTKCYALQYGLLAFQGKGSIGIDYYKADGTKISGVYANLPNINSTSMGNLATIPTSLQKTLNVPAVANASYALFYIWLEGDSHGVFDKMRLVQTN